MNKFLSIVLLSIPPTLGGKVNYDNCKFELKDTNNMVAEYDLSYFHLNQEVFRVYDTNNENNYKAFEYVFNICGSIDAALMTNNKTIPPACSHPNSNHGPCIKTKQNSNLSVPVCDEDAHGYENTAGKSPSALQIDTIDNTTAQCYWLGMEVASSDNIPEYKMELLNKNDAGKGVVFTILNGEWCADVGRNRELRVKLECPDDNRIEFEPKIHMAQISKETVEEVDTCVYEIAVVSPNACPNKCVNRLNLDMFAVCATHGICEADPYGRGKDNYPNGTLRCLCDDGYYGNICEKESNNIIVIDQTHPGLLAAIVICIVLLGIAIVCAAVLCHKIRMKEIEGTAIIRDSDLGGGMLKDANDQKLARTKVDAMSMNIGSGTGIVSGNARAPTSTAAVQLQGMDDQLESDKAVDTRNVLLDDEEQQNVVVEDTEQTNPGADV